MSRSSSKLDKEREEAAQKRLQILLHKMLQNDDNKYCADCDSKGPRWASWNLGLFLCIRCAGIHRNLGVHISRVKSVNLDSWTPMQVASMQLIGNTRAREIYEANMSDDFKRPQTDQQLEQFIRAKYERKKYIAKDFTPPKVPEFPQGWNELVEAERQKRDPRTVALPPMATGIPKPPQPNTATVSPAAQARSNPSIVKEPPKPAPVAASTTSLTDDLFGLSISSGITPAPAMTSGSTPQLTSAPASFASDLLGLGSTSANVSTTSPSGDFDFFGLSSGSSNGLSTVNNNSNPAGNHQTSNFSSDLASAFGGPNGNAGSGGGNAQPENGSSGLADLSTINSDSSSKMSKDSILALFNKPSANAGTAFPLPETQRPNMFNNFMPESGFSSNFNGQMHAGGFQNAQQPRHAVPNPMSVPMANPNATFGNFGPMANNLGQNNFGNMGINSGNVGNNFGALNNPFMSITPMMSNSGAPGLDPARNTVGAFGMVDNGTLHLFQ